MINLTEEDIAFLMENIITPTYKKLIEENLKLDDISQESYMRMFNSIADRIHELNYETVKDRCFMISYISAISGAKRKNVQDQYDQFSAEYDNLNKYILTEKEKS